MNIAMLSYHTCPLEILGGKNTGGMNVYVRELTRYLGRKGIRVDVFTRSQNEHIPQVSHDLGYFNRVVHIPAGPEINLPKEQLTDYTTRFARGIIAFSQRKGIRYDFIHAHYWLSGMAGVFLKKYWNIPLIQMFHTLGHMKQRIGRTPEEREGDYRIDGEQVVMKASDLIIAATEAERSQLEMLYNVSHHKVKIIPPGVDIHHFYPIPQDEAKAMIGIPQNDRMALYVGRIEPLKGVDTLIRAMAKMRENQAAFHCPHYLVIIGGEADDDQDSTNEEMRRLHALCKTLGLDEMVLFLGKRDQNALPYYYAAAEVVVMPSHYESFGMVALEAMACGTPVVASQVGGLAFLIKEGVTGYFVPSQNPEALAEKLCMLFSDQELRLKLGRQAVEYAQAYSWERITSEIIEVYHQLNREGKT